MYVLILNRRGHHVSTAKTIDNINSTDLHVTEIHPTTQTRLELGDWFQIGYLNGNNMIFRTLTDVNPERSSATFSLQH